MRLAELRQVDPDDFFDFPQEKLVRRNVGESEESLEKCGQGLADGFLLVEGEVPGGGEGVIRSEAVVEEAGQEVGLAVELLRAV